MSKDIHHNTLSGHRDTESTKKNFVNFVPSWLDLNKLSRILWGLVLLTLPVTSFRYFPLLGKNTYVRPLAFYPLVLLYLVLALPLPFIGNLLERFSPKVLIVTGAIGVSGGLYFLSKATSFGMIQIFVIVYPWNHNCK